MTGAGRRVLFVTSNGTGLGHLTRSMAVARRLAPDLEPLVFTLSAAAPVVREQGFPVEYCASYRTPGAGTEWRWSRRLRGRLAAAFEEADPAAIVFDGAHPYLGFLDSLRSAPDAFTVWCRRAMWRPGANVPALGRTRAFDAVLEPGDIAEAEDRGPTVERRAEAHRVGPMVYLRPDELLSREEAERELGLEPGRVNVLLQLGQGAEVEEVTARCLRHLAGREGVQVAALHSAIRPELELEGEVVHLRATYPISRYFAAFDAAVSAAGYNAYHELLRMRVPSLFVPMPRETDDQAARARHAQREGIGLGVEGPGSQAIEGLLDELADDGRRGEIAERLAQLDPSDGAAEAAEWLRSSLASAAGSGPAAKAAAPRSWHLPTGSVREAAEFAARVPRGVAALAKQVVTAPRPPRTVIVAIGTNPAELVDQVRRLADDSGDPPERVLVVTDSLDFAPIRRLGVGVEHVPAAGERQPDLAGLEYHSFLRRRLSLILAERRRPRRILALGETAESAVAALAR